MEEAVNENLNNNQEEDHKIEDLLNIMMVHLLGTWNQIKSLSSQVLREIGAYEYMDKLARKSAQHPYLALGISMACIIIALPFLILLVFALSTIVITFTGFIFLEGTLITVASVLLVGCLGGVLIVMLFFGGITLTGYFGFMHIYDLFNGLHNKTALRNFLNKEKTKYVVNSCEDTSI